MTISARVTARWSPWLRAGVMAAAVAAGSTAAAQQAPPDREDAALAYAQCMRQNGYAEFPDPTPDGGIQFRINRESAPRFHAAGEACNHLASAAGMGPMSPEDIEAVLQLAQCVRENGVPEFPDPDAQGVLNPNALREVGLDLNSSRVQSAMDACQGDGDGAPIRMMVGG